MNNTLVDQIFYIVVPIPLIAAFVRVFPLEKRSKAISNVGERDYYFDIINARVELARVHQIQPKVFFFRRQCMVFTRATLIQDQENKLRHLRNLRLNYFIYKHRNRGMDPITPYSEKIDLRTEHGRKIYEACTKPIPVIFDAVAGKHHSFATALRNTADERCWREICFVLVGSPPDTVTFDLLTHPEKNFYDSPVQSLLCHLEWDR